MPARQLARVQDLMEMVGLPRDGVFKYPHEFSGGQRQRIAIARALSVNPKLVVLDEPTSSIDVMSQAQLLELLTELKGSLKLTYILISHDLGVVNYMADRIAVMYLGKVVEYGRARAVFGEPKHPYTRALFNAIPNLQTRGIRDLATLEGDVPSAIFPPAGCRFHPRCERRLPVCGAAGAADGGARRPDRGLPPLRLRKPWTLPPCRPAVRERGGPHPGRRRPHGRGGGGAGRADRLGGLKGGGRPPPGGPGAQSRRPVSLMRW